MMKIEDLIEKSEGLSCTYKVTKEVYEAFQECSKDRNPLHVDAEFAQQKGFPKCVMYGNILNAFVSHFVGMVLPCKDVMIQSQDISYHCPVFLNDEIRLESKIETISEAVQIINYKLRFLKTSTNGKPQMVAKGHVQIGLLQDKN